MVNKTSFNKHATHPLQTWEWGEFREKTGNQIYRTNEYQLTIHPLPVFSNFKIGALIKGPKPNVKLIKELKQIAKEKKLIFIKMEPNVVKNKKDITLLKKLGAVPGKTLFTPSTFWINLSKSEEDLLKGFHSKTRYNIRYADRKGVKVVEDNSQKAFETFLKLYKKTTQRQGFYAHNEKYFRLLWETLKPSGMVHLLLAKHNKQTLTAWMLFKWGKFLYYPYGAWSGQKQNLQPNSLIMWEAIRLGKKRGCTTFDLWGREEGKGFTKFKEGFNPQIVEFLGTWDLPTSPLYWPYTVAEKLRWKILRLKSKLVRPKF